MRPRFFARPISGGSDADASAAGAGAGGVGAGGGSGAAAAGAGAGDAGAGAGAGSAGAAGGDKHWLDEAPDGLKTEKTLRSFKDPYALGQSYLELKKWQSGALKIPAADAKPEEIQAFREKLGVPKTAADYDLSALKGLPLDEARAKDFTGFAHSIGLSNEQVNKMLPWAMEREQHRIAQTNETHLQAHDKMADEYGKASYDQKVQLAQRTVTRFADPETKKYLDDTKLTNHPGLFRMMAAIGAQFAEDGVIDGRVEGVPTQEAAKAKIVEINAEIQKTAEGSPRRTDLLQQREEMFKLAYGTTDVSAGAGR